MIDEKLLNSNVLRRIYSDSTFQSNQLFAQWRSANLAGNCEAAERLHEECEQHIQIARSSFAELTKRGEALR